MRTLSMRWAQRSRDEHNRLDNPNALFGIVQGGMCGTCATNRWPGSTRSGSTAYAIGGLSVGEPKEHARILAHTHPRLPTGKPRYLMGVGTPEDLVSAVQAGIDMFDCVMPTRNARNGHLFTRFRRRSDPERRAIANDTGRSTNPATAHLPQFQPRLPAPPARRRNPRQHA